MIAYSSRDKDTFPLWLFIAALFHTVMLLGIHFLPPEPKKISKAIEITLVNSAIRNSPKEAHYLAQENQIGAGLIKQKPKPNQQKMPKFGQNKPLKGETRQPKKQKKPSHRVIAQHNKAEKSVMQPKKIAPEIATETAKLSLESLERQIAQLGEHIKNLEQSAEKTTIKFVNSISAHKYVAAQYVRNWEKKVERIGNLNYPQIAHEENFSGTLSMDVGINRDGSIYKIRIVQSSGNTVLDNAAIKIVKISAPFSPLPPPISQQMDVLIIRRVWSFSDDSRLSL